MDTKFASKTGKYIYIYCTTFMVVLIGFISDLFWVSEKVKYYNYNSGKHSAAQVTCIYTKKTLLDLRKILQTHIRFWYIY